MNRAGSSRKKRSQPTRCSRCGQTAPDYDIVNCGSSERGYQEICGQCFNAEVAESVGLSDFSHLQFAPVELLDCTGKAHTFHFRTGVYWRPIWAILEGQFELMLVNPHHVKAIPGRKTDAKDCEWIAELLQHGLVRGSFVPPTEIQDLRDLTRYRVEVTQAQARTANRIQKLLEQANVKLASVVSDTLGVSGQQMLDAIIAGEQDPEQLADLARRRLRGKIPELRLALEGRVRDHHRFLLKELLEEWRALGERIRRVEEEIERRIVPFEEAVALWESIPGMNRRTACNLVAEIGVNMGQFPSAQHAASWAGLCPGSNESAGKRMSGKTRNGNRWLRRTLCQGAWAVTRAKDCYLAAQFRRIAARRGMKRAVMAVAHSMLVIAYTMLKTGGTYQELGGSYLDEINRDQLQRYFTKRLERLGLTVTVVPVA